jgi:hypothetical protein
MQIPTTLSIRNLLAVKVLDTLSRSGQLRQSTVDLLTTEQGLLITTTLLPQSMTTINTTSRLQAVETSLLTATHEPTTPQICMTRGTSLRNVISLGVGCRQTPPTTIRDLSKEILTNNKVINTTAKLEINIIIWKGILLLIRGIIITTIEIPTLTVIKVLKIAVGNKVTQNPTTHSQFLRTKLIDKSFQPLRRAEAEGITLGLMLSLNNLSWTSNNAQIAVATLTKKLLKSTQGFAIRCSNKRERNSIPNLSV